MDLDRVIRKVLKEDEEYRSGRYMFFQNLQQMRRQCDLLLDLEPDMVEEILDGGHDWAQDHIAEAKNNMDQVFDFIMNESKKSGMELSMNIDDKDMMFEGGKRKKKPTGLWDNIRKKRARGEAPAKPGDEDYPDKETWNRLTKKSRRKSRSKKN